MNLFRIALYEIVYYAGWWLAFIPIAYCPARYFGWSGVFVGAAVLSLLVVQIDVNWIFDDMRQHPENGRDAGIVFWFGVLCRISLFKSVLLPFSAIGLLLRSRRRYANEAKDHGHDRARP
jgi:hypothetical protein